VHAIFFMVGNRITGYGAKPKLHELIQRILDEGHAIGNHTVNHKDLCKKSSADKVDYEIDENKKILEGVTGMHMVFFRTPFGVRCAQLEDALNARGLKHTHWDIDAQEWKTHDAVKTQNFIIKELGKLGDGQRAVVLIHDIHEATAKAIPVILDWIDEENAARARKGLRPMKLLGPVDIALERMDPKVMPALDGLAQSLLGAIPDLGRQVLTPLAGLGSADKAARL
jgi:peptidoglycan/xylan/chitin deacetylase (PgdA/CDA1 family)